MIETFPKVRGGGWHGCKDANELLVQNRVKLVESLQGLAERAVALDRVQWVQDTQKRIQSRLDGATDGNGKKTMLDYTKFADYVNGVGYSIRYNQITHSFEFFGFDSAESAL